MNAAFYITPLCVFYNAANNSRSSLGGSVYNCSTYKLHIIDPDECETIARYSKERMYTNYIMNSQF